jgi:hypothetical protein
MRLPLPSAGPKILEGKPKRPDDKFSLAFGHMTREQFYYYLMEAVVRSGETVPWHLIGQDEFIDECFRRGKSYLSERHPGAVFAT